MSVHNETRTSILRDAGVAVAEFDNYPAAQAAVDLFSGTKFDVSAVQIVGHGLHSVEDVPRRLTEGRAAPYGAGSGAWFGLLFGLLLDLFVPCRTRCGSTSSSAASSWVPSGAQSSASSATSPLAGAATSPPSRRSRRRATKSSLVARDLSDEASRILTAGR